MAIKGHAVARHSEDGSVVVEFVATGHVARVKDVPELDLQTMRRLRDQFLAALSMEGYTLEQIRDVCGTFSRLSPRHISRRLTMLAQEAKGTPDANLCREA